MRSLLNHNERAADKIVMTTNPHQMDTASKSDLREIAQHNQNKPSPKLQPMPNTNQNMRVFQPM